MAIPNDVEKFLQAIFPDYVKHAVFANLNPAAHTRDFKELDPKRDCYWSIATFPPDHAGTNHEDYALNTRALVVDDVGTKGPSEGAVMLALGEPTTIVESSAGNFQWGYRLSKPIEKDAWDGFFGGIEALIAHAEPLDAPAAQTLMRLPMGINTKGPDASGKMKLGHGGTFKVRLVKINPDREIDPDTIIRVHRVKSRLSHGAAAPWVHHIKEMVAILPNDFGYDEWIEYGERIKALAVDDEDGHEAWIDLSSRATTRPYDEALTEAKWLTFTADRTKGGLLVDAVQKIGGKAVDDWWQLEAPHVFDDGVKHPEVPPGRGRVQFKRGAHKEILATKANAELALTDFGITCAYDEFHHRAYIRRGTAEVEKLSDRLVLSLRGEINKTYGKDFGNVHIGEAIMALAYLNGFNPVTDMLSEAEKGWDGVKRLDQLGPAYFHTEDTKLARRCFRKVMIAAVRRARCPGCKFDQILVTESPEGWDKSSAWAVLAGEGNFSDADILGKDARQVQEELADIWIHEIADLSGLAKAEIERVKSFASRVNDRARPAFGRFLIDQPRQSIEVGTTNADVYLLSTTGNRRFWTFRLRSRVDIAALRRDRLQLWGEAAAAESTGETLELDRALWNVAAVAQEARRVVDPWEDELANLDEARMSERDGMQTITNLAIHDHLGGHRGQTFNSSSGRKLAEIMKRLGWERTMLTDADGKSVRGYQRARLQMSSVIQLPSVGKKTF